MIWYDTWGHGAQCTYCMHTLLIVKHTPFGTLYPERTMSCCSCLGSKPASGYSLQRSEFKIWSLLKVPGTSPICNKIHVHSENFCGSPSAWLRAWAITEVQVTSTKRESLQNACYSNFNSQNFSLTNLALHVLVTHKLYRFIVPWRQVSSQSACSRL